MDRFWSRYIQTTQELYASRAVRFREDNAALWLEKIGIQPGQRVLEIGCGGGLFCHRIKQAEPGVSVTGLDMDGGHIEWAKEKVGQMGLECEFVCADALHMPFADESFDLCFSYTVAEHLPQEQFLAEQRRVLRKGGHICVMGVRPKLSLRQPSDMTAEEEALLAKAWENVPDRAQERNVGMFSMQESEYPAWLERAGYKNVTVQIFTVMDYAPDSADIAPEIAREMIAARRIGAMEQL